MASVSRAYVHIGPLKTGTTFIQQVLWQNRDTLLRNGVVLPRHSFGEHVRSVLQLMGRMMNVDTGQRDPRQWRQLVAEVKEADAHAAVLSMEFLCVARPPAVKRLVRTLDPVEVHVVYTARDLTKIIPAAWQTTLRNKQVPSWSQFIDSVRATAEQLEAGVVPRPGRRGRDRRFADSWGARFWRQQDPRQVLGPYLQHVPADRVHVVTVPPSGAPPGLLWERFCQATGLEAGAYDTTVRRANTSLGGVECEVLRRVNTQVAGRIPGDAYGDLVKFFLAREVLEQRNQSFPLVLPDVERDWVAARTADALDFFSTAGVQVHGDLSDLSASGPGRPDARSPGAVSDAEVLPVLEETLGAVLLETVRRQGLRAYKGPRSYEQPMPSPGDLALTGDPPGPGTRIEGRARKGGFVDPPGVVALKSMGRSVQRTHRRERTRLRAAGTGAAVGAHQGAPPLDATTAGDEAAGPPGAGKRLGKLAARKAARKTGKKTAKKTAKKAAKKAVGKTAKTSASGPAGKAAPARPGKKAAARKRAAEQASGEPPAVAPD